MQRRFQYQLVIQFPGRSLPDYDALIELEDRIIVGISHLGKVDGHDMGVGEMNIFVHTDHPEFAFRKIRSLLDKEAMQGFRAAYREVGTGVYTILYPPGLEEFAVA